MRIDIWSDIVCPWCYIGKRRFERALAEFEHRDLVEIVHRSYQLNPHSPRGTTLDRRQVLQQKYGWSTIQAQEMDARMVATAAAEGLEYRLAGGVTGNTVDAHQLVHLGREQGVSDLVIERFYRAHFTEQRSIFDRDSLAALAVEAGLDATEAGSALQNDTYVDAVTADGVEATSLGITGVPCFILGYRFGVSGAQSVEIFTGALSRAWNDAATSGSG